MTARAPKKSETLEIRLPYGAKQAFMARCQADGVTASDTLRGFIDQQIEPAAARRPISRRMHWIAGAMIAAAVGAVAAPSLALALPALSHVPSFEQLDTNHDGVLTRAEFDR